jgi:hypothetical protein
MWLWSNRNGIYEKNQMKSKQIWKKEKLLEPNMYSMCICDFGHKFICCYLCVLEFELFLHRTGVPRTQQHSAP